MQHVYINRTQYMHMSQISNKQLVDSYTKYNCSRLSNWQYLPFVIVLERVTYQITAICLTLPFHCRILPYCFVLLHTVIYYFILLLIVDSPTTSALAASSTYLFTPPQRPLFLFLSLVSLYSSNPQASVQRYLCEPTTPLIIWQSAKILMVPTYLQITLVFYILNSLILKTINISICFTIF